MSNKTVIRYALVEAAVKTFNLIDTDLVVRIAEPLIAEGDADTHWYLGYVCESGFLGEPDVKEARSWYEKGAALGSTLAAHSLKALEASLSEVGEMVYEEDADGWPLSRPCFGDQIAPCSDSDRGSMFLWYCDAAHDGDPEMQTLVGLFYEHGIYVRRSLLDALEWYRRSAEGGLREAEQRCRLLGISCEKDA